MIYLQICGRIVSDAKSKFNRTRRLIMKEEEHLNLLKSIQDTLEDIQLLQEELL
jgi:hypothetical protein